MWYKTNVECLKNPPLSDADKIRLAARAKMEGNLKDLLPDKFTGASRRLSKQEDPLEGKLKFTSDGAKERCLNNLEG